MSEQSWYSQEAWALIKSIENADKNLLKSNLHRLEGVLLRYRVGLLDKDRSESGGRIALEADIRDLIREELASIEEEKLQEQRELAEVRRNIYPPPLTFKQQATLATGMVALIAVLFGVAQLCVSSNMCNF